MHAGMAADPLWQLHAVSLGPARLLAVAAKAEVLVMDEPLVHVDPARVGKYWRAIREHLAKTGASLVFSTHTPETAVGEAQHALCLRAGRVLHCGPVATLYREPPDEEL